MNNYYRRITVSLPQGLKKRLKRTTRQIKIELKSVNLKYHLINLSIMFMAILFILQVFLIILTYAWYYSAKEEFNRAETDFAYWENVVDQHPNFTDGFYNAALSAAKLGETGKAITYIQKALILDPEFQAAEELEEKIIKGAKK